MNMNEPTLFSDGAGAKAAAAAPSAPAESTASPEQVRAILESEPLELLPETNDALGRMPEVLREPALELAKRVMRAEFVRVGTPYLLTPAEKREWGVSLHVLAHTSKMAALSSISYLANSPWQLADAGVLAKMAAALQSGTAVEPALAILNQVRAVNLFVAAAEDDDRSSYIKSVKAILKRHKVHSLVFDAELVEWTPESEFLEACAEVGLRPNQVGIADRESASRHSIMTAEARATGRSALFVDTRGRTLQLGPKGRVLPFQDETQAAPVSTTPVQWAQTTQSQARQSVEPAPVSGPPSAIRDRIANLRADQRRRAARP